MADYISRDDFAKHLDDIQYGEAPTGRTGENIDYQKGVYAGFDMAYVALKRFPAADVRPVVRGYWKPVRESEISGYDPALSGQDPIYMHICSNCGIDSYLDENGQELLTAFCPMCGADMREETDA